MAFHQATKAPIAWAASFATFYPFGIMFGAVVVMGAGRTTIKRLSGYLNEGGPEGSIFEKNAHQIQKYVSAIKPNSLHHFRMLFVHFVSSFLSFVFFSLCLFVLFLCLFLSSFV
jgi:hypothetical protein